MDFSTQSPLKKVYRDRLRKLARMLVADAKRKKGIKFDLTTVGHFSTPSWEETQKVELNCGTTACAMGLASISGEFKRSGLSYAISSGNNTIHCLYRGNRIFYQEAAVLTFGISFQVAEYLFNPATYPNSKLKGAKAELYVAQRIRDTVKKLTPKKRKTKK